MIPGSERTGTCMRNPLPTLVVTAVAATLCGCSERTDMSLTGNTPAAYSHVFITTQEVWFNKSGTAGPNDGGWVQFSLSTPQTVDLVGATGGNLGTFITGMRLIAGTYNQVLLVPLDNSQPLALSAQSAGALYNSEADYIDASGTTQQVPLGLLNPQQGFGVPSALKVPIGKIGPVLGAAAVASHNGGTNTQSGTTTAANPVSTAVSNSSSSGTSVLGSSSSSQPPNSFDVNIDGAMDLVPFTYSGALGVLLSSHATAYDLSQVGAISGTVTLTNITGISGPSGVPAIQATAEVTSTDGSRHVPVISTPVNADGTFLIYPLTTSSSAPAYYDVVIHGPGIATIIIKAIPVPLSNSTATPTPLTSTTTTTSSTSNPGTTNSSINSVSLGTFTPRSATYYTANLTPSAAQPLPAGAFIGFYQTLGAAGEVPYLITGSALDPFNQNLAIGQPLGTQTIDSGTFTSGGSNIRVVSAAPKETAGTYIVAAFAPYYTGGALTPTVSQANPATSIPGLTLIAGTPGTISATVTQGTPGVYDSGQLLVSHDGQLIATAPLNPLFTQPSPVVINVSGMPAQTSSALYYVSVQVWLASNPASLKIESSPTPVDLRGSTSGSIQLTVN